MPSERLDWRRRQGREVQSRQGQLNWFYPPYTTPTHPCASPCLTHGPPHPPALQVPRPPIPTPPLPPSCAATSSNGSWTAHQMWQPPRQRGAACLAPLTHGLSITSQVGGAGVSVLNLFGQVAGAVAWVWGGTHGCVSGRGQAGGGGGRVMLNAAQAAMRFPSRARAAAASRI